jgi:hypothetical protein
MNRPTSRALAVFAVAVLTVVCSTDLFAHGVSAADKAFMEQGGLLTFIYLGAKHQRQAFPKMRERRARR